MNRKRKIKQMRKFISKYGVIKTEYVRPKDEYYRKGSYYAVFDSEKLDICCCVGHIDKYYVYKSIVRNIKDELNKL